MNNKDVVLRGLFSAIGFIRAAAPYDVRDEIISELNSAVNSVRNNEPHEEYKAAWLNIVNTLHGIDPDWQENTQGESEWEKAVAFISQMNQALRRIQDHNKPEVRLFADFDVVKIEDLSAYIRKYYAKGIRSGYLTGPSYYLAEREASTRAVIQEAISQISDELAAAEKKHPTWPTDIIHASAILNEEAGKLTQAAIDYHYHNGSLEKVRSYAARAGAMAVRVLINLPYAERPEAPVVKVTGAPR